MEQLMTKVKERLQNPSSPLMRLNQLGVEMKLEKIRSFLVDATENNWAEIKTYQLGKYSLQQLTEMHSGSGDMPTSVLFQEVLEFGTSNIQVISVEQEGKTFKAYVKVIMLEPDGKTIAGLSLGGNLTACRAIHASLYNNPEVIVTDLLTGGQKQYVSNHYYRRVEEVHDKVCHMFLLPRLAIVEEYQEECMAADAAERPHPDRILMAREGDIEELAGQFLAQKYSLPRTKDWADKYLSLLPSDKWHEMKVITTDMAGDGAQLRAITLKSMKEKEILDIIDKAILDGELNVFTEIGERATLTEGMTTEEYLRENAEVLAKKIEEYLKPLYDGHSYQTYLGMTNRLSLPAQARSVMGILAILLHGKSAFLTADMGSGKTQMSLSVIYAIMRNRIASGAQDGIRVLITAPSITIPKWAGKEIPEILGEHSVNCTIINSTDDALRYVRQVKTGHRVPKGKIEFVLVSTDRMKLSANKFVLGAIWKHQKKAWFCPDCGKALRSPKAKENECDVLATWEDAVESPKEPPIRSEIRAARLEGNLDTNGLPRNYIKRYTSLIRQFQCTCHLRKRGEMQEKVERSKSQQEGKKERKRHCSLARPALKARGEDRNKPRWMIAEIFQRHLPNHFHVGLFDEIQQMKASDSGRGLAFHKLLKSCRKSIFLTGTLTNGASSSIQATLWRSDAGALIEEGFKHNTTKELWAQKYGVIEKITYLEDANEGVVGRSSNRRAERVQVKEKPGIAPQLVARHLLHKSVFLELADLGLPLVQLKEEPVIVELEEDHAAAYRAFHNELYEACKSLQQELGSKAWAKFNPSTLNYAAQPQLGAVVNFEDEKGNLLKTVRAPEFPENYITATEKRLVADVKSELSDNRGCIIFTNFTGVFRTNQRIQKILSEQGIESEILDVSTTSSIGRFEWLEKHRERGTKVLIMNATLVQVGLDLLEWPTLMFWQMNDNIDVVRQASRRAWRIGQPRECRVFYYVSEKTQQMAQFQRLMSRRIHALLVEGRIERSDSLAQYANDESSNLTRDLAGCLSATELTETWKSAAEKDMDQNLTLVSEAEYKQAISDAFARLTAETKRLCGVNDEEVKESFDFRANVEEYVTTEIVEPHMEKVVEQPISLNFDRKVGQLDIFDFNLKVTTIKTKERGSKEVVLKEQMAFDFGF